MAARSGENMLSSSARLAPVVNWERKGGHFMKLMHLSDLHLGKRLHEYSLLEDQQYILDQILAMAKEEGVEAALLSGDIYDKAVPPTEAVTLFGGFLAALKELGIEVFVINGNHDSPERLAFAAALLAQSGVHIAPVYQGVVHQVSLHDRHGALTVHLLPFLKPAQVRRHFPQSQIQSYDEALRLAVGAIDLDTQGRNLILAHQFVTGATRCESEELIVGGVEDVGLDIFDGFDYVALGHLHSPQQVGRETVRYCGSPLKYSFSEAKQEKSLTLVTLEEKGFVTVKTRPLRPLRDLRVLRGSYWELSLLANYEGTPREDYLQILLTDEEEVPEALGRLRAIYPNLLHLTYDNTRTRSTQTVLTAEGAAEKSPLALFEELYLLQNNSPMSQSQRALAEAILSREEVLP